jgi:excisionase family DNA binding protein
METGGHAESSAWDGAAPVANHARADAAATERLLTARTVADQFGVSSETVLRWARLGELPSIQLSNRAIRFVASEIEEWMRSRARTTRRNGAHPA